MSTMTSDGTTEDPVDPQASEALAQARARRMAALQAVEGLWKDRTDIPKDGVQAQEQLRAEWH